MKLPRRSLTLVPVLIFIALAVVLMQGLLNDPKLIPSVLIGKPAPQFDLPAVEGLTQPGISSSELKKGGVTVVNVWASWCVPCRQEQPVLMELAKRTDFRLVGIDNKDAANDARDFLGTYGNPFSAIGADVNGRATIEWGSYGVPETFIIDGAGIIRYKVIGSLEPAVASGTLDKEIAKAAKPQS